MVIYTKNTLYDWRFIMINRNSGCNNEENVLVKKKMYMGILLREAITTNR